MATASAARWHPLHRTCVLGPIDTGGNNGHGPSTRQASHSTIMATAISSSVNILYWVVAGLAVAQWFVLVRGNPLDPLHSKSKVALSGLAFGVGLLLLAALLRADFRKHNLFFDAIPVILMIFGPLLLLVRPSGKPAKYIPIALVALPVLLGFGHAVALQYSDSWYTLYIRAWSKAGITFS